MFCFSHLRFEATEGFSGDCGICPPGALCTSVIDDADQCIEGNN